MACDLEMLRDLLAVCRPAHSPSGFNHKVLVTERNEELDEDSSSDLMDRKEGEAVKVFEGRGAIAVVENSYSDER